VHLQEEKQYVFSFNGAIKIEYAEFMEEFKMKSKRKLASFLITIVMVFGFNFSAIATSTNLADELFIENILEGASLADEVKFIEDFYLTDVVLTHFDSKSKTIGGSTDNTIDAVTQNGDIFDRFGTLSPNDAIDFHLFTLSNARVAIARFLTENTNYAAILGLVDSLGNVTLSNVWLYHGDSLWFTLPAGNYCWVVLSTNNTYTNGQYRISMNARNPNSFSGASVSGHVATSANFSHSSFIYSNGVVLLNGNNIYTQINNYLNNQMSGTVFQDRYQGPSPSNIVATVGVVSDASYVIHPLYYGNYTSTNPNINTHTGTARRSSEHVIFIPIDGYVFACSISGTFIPYQFIRDIATGFIIYDLITGTVIDYMSPSNIFYTPGGFFNYTYSYSIYMQLN
jgi:hypothetical protein